MERNVIPEVALAQVPVDVGIQSSHDFFGGTKEHGASGKETIRAPDPSAAIDEGIG